MVFFFFCRQSIILLVNMKILTDTYLEFEVIFSESKNGCHNFILYPNKIPFTIPKYLIKDYVEEHTNRLQKVQLPVWFLKKNRIIPLNS